ncbi:MAG: response regulator transcription factor [Candidatus Obscuribacterales bacterium]|nr:response regulator transcription factor [Candidatus Obscuribacterales bacterium]
MTKILVVEDDLLVVDMVRRALNRDGHLVDAVSSVNAAMTQFQMLPYQLLVLDWSLPDGTGPALCQELRAQGAHLPILFLTARDSLQDKKVGYGAGGDDYLPKPFEPDELRMKVSALLRRPPNLQPNEIKMRNIVLNIVTHQVFKNEQEIHLLPKEYALLEFFMTHPGQIFKAEALLDRIWSSDSSVGPDTIRVTLMRVRQKLEYDFEDPFIVTVRSFGYRLDV